jgi:Fe2+ transport system protein FeoA
MYSWVLVLLQILTGIQAPNCQNWLLDYTEKLVAEGYVPDSAVSVVRNAPKVQQASQCNPATNFGNLVPVFQSKSAAIPIPRSTYRQNWLLDYTEKLVAEGYVPDSAVSVVRNAPKVL